MKKKIYFQKIIMEIFDSKDWIKNQTEMQVNRIKNSKLENNSENIEKIISFKDINETYKSLSKKDIIVNLSSELSRINLHINENKKYLKKNVINILNRIIEKSEKILGELYRREIDKILLEEKSKKKYWFF
jgi:hypothetical protein